MCSYFTLISLIAICIKCFPDISIVLRMTYSFIIFKYFCYVWLEILLIGLLKILNIVLLSLTNVYFFLKIVYWFCSYLLIIKENMKTKNLDRTDAISMCQLQLRDLHFLVLNPPVLAPAH